MKAFGAAGKPVAAIGHGFKVVLGDDRSQAAQMTLAPGETEGGPDNRHKGGRSVALRGERERRGDD